MKLLTFEQWAADWEAKELGAKALITNKLAMTELKREIKTKVADLMSNAFSQGIADNGLRFKNGKLWTERDASLRAQELAVIIDAVNGKLPVEYVNFAYSRWEAEYRARAKLQNLSLYQWSQWWFRRLRLKWRKHYRPEEIY